ncbi:hypothetical protein HH214_07415 [Mucilaginibacter robiniae]|uniref:Uncharacterized protein n=1 Tax=Mucilaginibacter robiniae TaxID=2728022 RepID=A0A7L5DY69_9SPHI|nr:hypothetical protein [Mucilaginibacter robiniae]QJD95711.1 hypothetical protein HH214_07415 [Mucilaginibacter robiniae]
MIGLLQLSAYKPINMPNPLHDAPNKYVITHYNITFAPDLSNRVNPKLYQRPLSDVDILAIIAGDLYPTILREKRSENQKDKLLVDFINKGLISQYAAKTDKLLIDFGRFHRQNERIDYIMERNHVPQTLNQDVQSMVREFSRIYNIATHQNFGADIWTYLNEGVDDKIVIPAEPPLANGSMSIINTYRNVMILTTDGYIEAGIYGKGFDLSKTTVDNFRKAFLASKEDNIQKFFKKNTQFRIKPVHNEHLKNLEVLVLELYDRSKSKGGSATIQPTDMEIIKLFWADWLQQSHVKRWELHPYANSKDEAEKTILQFLGVTKKNMPSV